MRNETQINFLYNRNRTNEQTNKQANKQEEYKKEHEVKNLSEYKNK